MSAPEIAAARRILDAVLECMAIEGIEPPDRKYVTIGSEVFDCEQITVSWVRTFDGTPGSSPAPGGPCPTRSADYRILVVRCAPTLDDDGAPPEPADLEAYAESMLADRQAIERHLKAELGTKRNELSIGDATPVVTGDLGGIQIPIVAMLTVAQAPPGP